MRTKKLLPRLLCLLAALTLLLPPAAFAHVREPKVVRVGWYESAFHRTDRFGRRSGYGYEYQQRIATYTGWTYEYVEGSWSELFEKLVAGEIDLLSDVSYTPERAEKILYSAEAMGGEDYHVFIAPDNTDIRPDDFSTMNGRTVGVNKNSIQEQLFLDWAEKHGVRCEVTELSVKTPEMLEMLARGEIDMLVTLDTYGNTADIVPVCKVGSAASYFGVSKARPDVKQELDAAMGRLLEDNRDFNEQMTEKFNRASAVNSFLIQEERDWLADHGTIRVGFRDEFLPYCDTDDGGALTGALADYLAFAATAEKNAALSFRPVAYPTTEAALEALDRGEVDCVFPVNLSAWDGEQRGVLLTDPVVTTEMFVAVRAADRLGVSPERDMTAAVLRGHLNHETFLMDHFPGWRIVRYDDAESALNAVRDGAADCLLISNYRISLTAEQCAKYRLAPLSTGEDMDLTFAVRREDDSLYSILNKVNRLHPDSALNASLTAYSVAGERVTFLKYLKDNMAEVIAAVAVIAAVLLLLLLRNVRARNKVVEGRQLISETERDDLTGLYTKSFFIAYVERFCREHPERAMDAVVMNIERFHSLNTLNGRAFGDEVLTALGEEVEAFAAETGAIVSRTEGDSFDIFCDRRDDYPAVLERFQRAVRERFPLNEIVLRMGVCPWQPGVTPEQMFSRAWSACSLVRGDYKSHLMVYNEELRLREEFDRCLLNDLTHGLEAGELEVFYQPKYAIRTEPATLHSAEALVRWNHPKLGTVVPGDFVQLFERSGQISALDRYVWATAAKQVAAWRDRLGRVLPVSVNLSRVDVFDPALPAVLDGIIADNGLDRADLKLEITESAYTEDADQLIRIIGQLREKGYQIEMDDFGSGYSSLNMLSSMPIDVLKMDMAFIRNIERSARDLRLVELILDIARYLKVPVVAEGVETERQLRLLRDAGCDIVQGYYFSRPLTAEEFTERILALPAEGAPEKETEVSVP